MHKRNKMATVHEELSQHLKHSNMSSQVILHGIVYKKLARFVNCMKGTQAGYTNFVGDESVHIYAFNPNLYG